MTLTHGRALLGAGLVSAAVAFGAVPAQAAPGPHSRVLSKTDAALAVRDAYESPGEPLKITVLRRRSSASLLVRARVVMDFTVGDESFSNTTLLWASVKRSGCAVIVTSRLTADYASRLGC